MTGPTLSYEERKDLVRDAQEKLFEAIEALEQAFPNDGNTKAYMIDQLKILATEESGFLSSGLNLDKLLSRIDDEEEEENDDDFCGSN